MRSPPSLSHFLTALERERLASEIELKRLTPAETGKVIRAIFNQKQLRDEFLDAIQTLTDADLAKISKTPVGNMPLGTFIGLWVINAHVHAGEISCLKGLKGLQGYPA